MAWRRWFPPTALASQGLGMVQGESTESNHSSAKACLLPPAGAPSILRQTCRFAQLRYCSFLSQVPVTSPSPVPGRP